jgi:A/G-specific adenine glycosylase
MTRLVIGLLLAWYEGAARDLPWRRTSDPYAIWISEAMLQQTRVETVIGYWTRFLEAFPTVGDLAAAEEETVLAAWSGLGYYRRARSLHAAAREVVERHGGAFPREHAAALALPGVGPYTAAAVLSIAHDASLPLVDGNVERVFARRFLLEEAAGSPGLQRAAWALAAHLVPAPFAGTWNQALMELGATVCTPRAPRCSECPWTRSCAARRADRAQELPAPKLKPAQRDVELELAWIHDGARLLLERRPQEGRMAGMWQLPTRELTATDLFPSRFGAHLGLGDELGRLRHGITSHRIQGRILAGRPPARLPVNWAWFPPGRLAELPLTGMTKKALRRVQPPD